MPPEGGVGTPPEEEPDPMMELKFVQEQEKMKGVQLDNEKKVKELEGIDLDNVKKEQEIAEKPREETQ